MIPSVKKKARLYPHVPMGSSMKGMMVLFTATVRRLRKELGRRCVMFASTGRWSPEAAFITMLAWHAYRSVPLGLKRGYAGFHTRPNPHASSPYCLPALVQKLCKSVSQVCIKPTPIANRAPCVILFYEAGKGMSCSRPSSGRSRHFSFIPTFIKSACGC